MPVEDSEVKEESRSNSKVADRPIQKRRRKISSCDSCRKMKTRCEYDVENGICHRCLVLRIKCSLDSPNGVSIKRSVPIKRINTIDNDRISQLEAKMDLLIERLSNNEPEKSDISSENENEFREINKDWNHLLKYGLIKKNYLDNSIRNSPNFIITSLDFKLFKRIKSYEIFSNLVNEKFIQNFYYKHKELVLNLSSDFLKIAHFWIIPGGINEIDEDYVLEHPFITSVFVLISMTFDENYEYVTEQKELNSIVKEILSLSLITKPLTDHDIEAILYCCIFNISRKPLQSLLDTWSLSGDGIKKMISSINFINIENRVSNDEFDDNDLFHLRIWILLNINHLFNSIGYGRPNLTPTDYYKNDIGDLILRFPNIVIGDKINYYLLKLMKLIYKMFYSNELFENLIKFNEIKETDGVLLFNFKDFSDWYDNCKDIIESDSSGILLFTIDYYYITFSKRFVSFYKKHDLKDKILAKYLNIGYNTAIYHAQRILERFLELPGNWIRGSPIHLWNQVVYSCLTLYEFNDRVNEENNSLNLISRIYWKLNQINEAKNDFTDTVGQIIKSLVDVNNHLHEMIPEDDLFTPLHDEINFEFSDNFTDITKFNTFEEFFNDITMNITN